MIGSAASKVTWVGRARTLAFWFLALLVAASVGVLVGTRPAHAVGFRVNYVLEDAGDFAAGDGQCSIEPVPVGTRGNCTLRAAIEEANANEASDDITFSSGLSGATIVHTLGQLAITDDVLGPDLSIEGPEGSALSVSGNNNSGVFKIDGSEATIESITIRGGTSVDPGAGINNSLGTLTLANSTVSGSTSASGTGGGGIYNGGTLTLTDSTVSGNTSTGFGHGGGIANFGTLTLTNATVSGNTSRLAGGGIYTGGGTLTLTNATVSGNTAGNFGGGIFTSGAAARLANTIVAGNTAVSNGPDANGTFTSQGNNLIGNTEGATGFGASDLLNRNPLLGPLQNNGGPTDTRALLPGSPAIDAADNGRCLFTDQRGVVRRDGDRNGSVVCDIGAYERSDFGSPRVNANTPAAGAARVKRSANLTATFSEKMTRSTLNTATFKLFRVRPNGSATQISNITVGSATDGLKATLNPFGTSPTLLGANTTYRAIVTTGARDLAGNQLDQSPTIAGKQQKAWTFKTGST